MRIINWFRARLRNAQVAFRLQAMGGRLSTLDRQRDAATRRIQRRERELGVLQQRMGILAAGIETDLEEQKETERHYEREIRALELDIEKLRARLQIAEDVTIPTLIADHAKLLAVIEADTAVEVRRRVAYSPTRMEE